MAGSAGEIGPARWREYQSPWNQLTAVGFWYLPFPEGQWLVSVAGGKTQMIREGDCIWGEIDYRPLSDLVTNLSVRDALRLEAHRRMFAVLDGKAEPDLGVEQWLKAREK